MSTPLIINLGLAFDSEAINIIVTNRVLRWSDTSAPYAATGITYTLTTAPTSGKLQLQVNNIWTDLAATSTFTQDDIDNHRLRYVPDATTPATTSFTLTATDGTSTTPVSTVSVTLETFDPLEQDNQLDHSTVTASQEINTGRGEDTIKPGSGDDRIKAGRDDDSIDLSIGGADEVYYDYQSASTGYVALDGGDDITGFKRGEDRLIFGSTKEDEFWRYVNDKYKVMVTFEQTQTSTWQVTGLEFIFTDAVYATSGALASGVLSLKFATPISWTDFQTLVQEGTAQDGFDNNTGLITTPEALAAVLGHNSIAPQTTGTPPPDVEVDIFELHPLTKAVHQVNTPTGLPGGTFTLASGVDDNDLFTIDANGKIWWRDFVDYENSLAAGGGNVYRVQATHTSADGTTTTITRLDINVQDILLEEDGTSSSTRQLTGVDTIFFIPVNIPADALPPAHPSQPTVSPETADPKGYIRTLLSGHAFASPTTGPLTLTWSFNSLAADSLLQTQADIDAARLMINRAFAEFESAANLKFVEVGRNGADIRGDIRINLINNQQHSGEAIHPGDGTEYSSYATIRGPSVAELRYSFVVREIGYALGLSHPSESTSGWPGHESFRTAPNTVMSHRIGKYNDGLESADILALQFMYGRPGTYFESIERFFDTSRAHRNPYFLDHRRAFVPEDTDTNTVIYKVRNYLNSEHHISPITFHLDPTESDNRFFTIDADDGEIRLKEKLDFEEPLDGTHGDLRYARNNVYEIQSVHKVTANFPSGDPYRDPGIQEVEFRQFFTIVIRDVDEPLTPPATTPDII